MAYSKSRRQLLLVEVRRYSLTLFIPYLNSEIGVLNSVYTMFGIASRDDARIIADPVVSLRDGETPVRVALSPQLDTLAVVHSSGIQIRSVRDKFKSVKAFWKCTALCP
jgi:hypothetical protein